MALTKILVLASCLVLTGAASGAPLMVENFDFSGNLTNNGWTAHSGGGTQPVDTVPGLSYAGYPGSGIGNAANLDNTGEDVHTTFTEQTAGSVYASFLINANAASVGYFLHFGQSIIGTTFRGKVFIGSDGTGDYELALSVGNNTAQATTNLDLAFNTTYLVVLRFDIIAGATNDAVSMYVFSSGVPATEPATPTLGPLTDALQTDLVGVGSIAFRQSLATQRIVLDSVRVAQSWGDAPLPVAVSRFSIE